MMIIGGAQSIRQVKLLNNDIDKIIAEYENHSNNRLFTAVVGIGRNARADKEGGETETSA